MAGWLEIESSCLMLKIEKLSHRSQGADKFITTESPFKTLKSLSVKNAENNWILNIYQSLS